MGYENEQGKMIFRNFYKSPSVEVSDVDFGTFRTLEVFEWAKDSQHVYYKGVPIEGLDASTFQIKSDGYMWDKNHAWYNSEKVPSKNPHAFESLGNGYGTDTTVIFWGLEPVISIQPHSFVVTYEDRGIGITNDGVKVHVLENKTVPLQNSAENPIYTEHLSEQDMVMRSFGEAREKSLKKRSFLFPFYPLAPELLAPELQSFKCDSCKQTDQCLKKRVSTQDSFLYFCLQCIASGKAKPVLEKNETALNNVFGANEVIEYETPPIHTIQDYTWPEHCDTPCAFLTYAGKKEFSLLAKHGDGERLFEETTMSWHPQMWETLSENARESYEQAYIFVCRDCDQLMALEDVW